MAIVTNIISAIGNNNSLAPLIVRDLGIENPVKVSLTYKQNKSNKEIAYLATRERLIDEYSVSTVWLGGVPAVGWLANKLIKKQGFNPEISSNLLKEAEFQGLKYNIEKFKEKAPEAVADLEKISKDVDKYRKCLTGKFLMQTIIPVTLMGWIIPKSIFALTAKSKARLKEKELQLKKGDCFVSENPKNEKRSLNFTGANVSMLADLSDVQKLFITDAGYAAGRISTARKRNEAYDIGVRMAGMMYLNYVFPKQLEKVMNFVSKKCLQTSLDLDVKLLDNKEFLKSIGEGTLELPKSDKPNDLIEFVDKNPSAKFTKYADKYGKIKMLNSELRDPRAYVDFKALGEFRNSIENLSNMAKNIEGADYLSKVQNYAKFAKYVKTFTILANIGITSSLLAFGLPKLQFLVREKITGSKLEPGILD